MLNIPEAVKNLYKEETTESIRKNLRITFPDGQLSDDFPNGITCNNIVAESMRFTESVCSQDNFKFGTSEAPVIEFETVGVPNILGYRIQAWLEIETTTVSDDLTGDYDGEFIALADSDLGFPFYRLPLGVFTVQSCPRSHGAMTHRQITAMGASFSTTSNGLDSFTYWKLSQLYTSPAWNIDFDFLAPSLYGDTWGQSGNYYDATELTGTETTFDANETLIEFPGAPSGKVTQLYTTRAQYPPVRGCKVYSGQQNKTLRIVRKGYSSFAADFRANVTAAFESLDSEDVIDWSLAVSGASGAELGSMDACIDELVSNMLQRSYFSVYVLITTGGGTARYMMPIPTSWPVDDKDAVINLDLPAGATAAVYIPFSIPAFRIYATDEGALTISRSCAATVPEGSAVGAFSLALKSEYLLDFPTLELPTTLTVENGGVQYYGYFNSFSFSELIAGFFEASGQVGRRKRDGSIEPLTISAVPVATIQQDEAQSLWWDDSAVQAVGSVAVTYIDQTTGSEESAVITIGSGASSYDMTNNYYFKKWPKSLAEITALVQGAFTTAAAALTWTPTDATQKGFPWIEAGDWIEAETGAEDITAVGFPVLRRELTGIQSLTDTITSVAGEVTEIITTTEESTE